MLSWLFTIHLLRSIVLLCFVYRQTLTVQILQAHMTNTTQLYYKWEQNILIKLFGQSALWLS